jgi:hypothetical protein
MDKNFNEKWFGSSWNKIVRIEPHYIKVIDEEGEEIDEPVIDRLDIVFEDDGRVRIEAHDFNKEFEDEDTEHPLFPYLKIQTQEFKEVKPQGDIEKDDKLAVPPSPKGKGIPA